jgi:putative transposase
VLVNFHFIRFHIEGNVRHVQEVVGKILFDYVALVAAADNKIIDAMKTYSNHGGLVEAAAKHFQCARWQRCQVHLMRNLLGHSSTKVRADVAANAKLVFQAPDMVEARRRRKEFVEIFAKSAPKAVACMEAGFEDAMAVMVLPEKYRRRLRTTNMQERLIEEIRRRERVIWFFPNDASALRLIGALLAEKNEDW